MRVEAINLADKLARFSDLWAPRIVAQMNDYHIKLVKIRGEFVWHSHPETDEVFIVIEGNMSIQFRDGEVRLNRGEMCVIPKGVEHKPYAEDMCQIMLLEPAGTNNTGDTGGELTAENDVWI